MGKRLAEAAKQLFSRIEGAKVESRGNALVCTVTPAQWRKHMESDPIGRAMLAVEAKMRPCAKCSEGDWFPRRRDGSIGSGRWSGGVATTLPDKDGACSNCGTFTSEEDRAKLAANEQAALDDVRRVLSDKGRK